MHTAGSWQCNGARFKWRYAGSDQVLDSHLVGPDGDAVCLVFYTPKHHAEQLANARLISSAPDLLAALQGMLRLIGHHDGDVPFEVELAAHNAAHDAIRKAIGDGLS